MTEEKKTDNESLNTADADEQKTSDKSALKTVLKEQTNSPLPAPELDDEFKKQNPNHNLNPSQQDSTYRIKEFDHLAGTSEAEINSPLSLKGENWEWLIRKNQLCSGIDMNQTSPRPSFKQAVDLKADQLEFICFDTPEVSFNSTYSEMFHSRIKSSISKSSANFSCPFLSISASHFEKSYSSTQQTQKQLHTTAHWDFPRAIINLSPEMVEPTSELLKDFHEALCNFCKNNMADEDHKNCTACSSEDKPGNSKDSYEDAFEKLCKVLEKYGSAWTSEITLGGQLTISGIHTLEAEQTRTEKETAWQVAASAAYKGFSGGGSHGESNANANDDKELKEFKSKIFTAKGGNTILGQNPEAWMKTIGLWQNWSVIKRSKLIPLYQLLDHNCRKTVENILKSFKPMRIKIFIKHNQVPLRKFKMDLQVPKGFKIIGGGATISSLESANFLQCCAPNNDLTKMTLTAGDVTAHVYATALLFAIAVDNSEDEWLVEKAEKIESAPKTEHCVTASLPEGYYITGGGAEINETHKGVDGCQAYLMSSHPVIEKQGWGWQAKSHDCDIPTAHTLRVWAIGIKAKSNRILDHTVITSKSDNPEYLPEVSASLTDGFNLIGGGADINISKEHFLFSSFPDLNNNCWSTASRAIPQNAMLTSYAIGMKNIQYDAPEILPTQPNELTTI